MVSRTILPVLLTLAAVSSAPMVLTAAPESPLTFAVPGFTTTFPADVNNRGDVVGTANNCDPDPSVGFIYRNGVYTIISFPEAAETHVTDINERGVAIGYAWVANSSGALVAHPFIVSRNQIVPLASTGGDVLPNGINARGDIVGVVPRRTFLRDARGQFAILQPPEGVNGMFASAITASGLIVGNALLESAAGTRFAGFVLDRGRFTLLPQFSSIDDVNERGDLLAAVGFGLPQIFRRGDVLHLPRVSAGRVAGISNTWAVGATVTTRPTPDGPCFDAVGFMTRL